LIVFVKIEVYMTIKKLVSNVSEVLEKVNIA